MDSNYERLIAKKLANDISMEEERQFDKWLAESKDNRRAFKEYQESWKSSNLSWEVDNSKKVYESIGASLDFQSVSDTKVVSIYSRRNLTRIAAAIALLIGISTTLYYSGAFTTPKPQISDNLIIKNNPKGKKTHIKLPDGTMVKLNSGSYLEYPEHFGKERRIKLIGEAFFDVTKDTSRPFIVESENLNVRVLGTSFNVRAFPYDDSYSVAVASGLVSVTDQRKSKSNMSMQLQANEMVIYEHNSGNFRKKTFDGDHYFAWKNGVLDFQKADFEEIIKRLERWYGVKFIVQNENAVVNGFSGRYENASLRHVLEGISFANNFEFSLEGDTVIIK